ncbi:MAG: DUF2513 domain-containing protein [Akkermansia sp.]|nr:DUF2513 domain-containing protein [Akkermansia sp.]
MKRNWDLIRLILLNLEGETDTENLNDYSDNEVLYHVQLLLDKQLIADCQVKTYIGGQQALIGQGRLTFEGHDFLDKIRNETVWTHIKSQICKVGDSLTYSIIDKLATLAFNNFLDRVLT